MPKSATQTQAEHIAQLQILMAVQASPPVFKVGQLVRRRAISLPKAHRDERQLTIAAVIETISSMRNHTGLTTDTKGPAVRLAFLDDEGGYREALCESWMYEPLTHDQIAAITGQTSH